MCLQNGFCITLFRDEVLYIHRELQQLFEATKGYWYYNDNNLKPCTYLNDKTNAWGALKCQLLWGFSISEATIIITGWLKIIKRLISKWFLIFMYIVVHVRNLDNFNLLQSSTDQLENSPQCQCRCRCRVVNANYRSATSWGGGEGERLLTMLKM